MAVRQQRQSVPSTEPVRDWKWIKGRIMDGIKAQEKWAVDNEALDKQGNPYTGVLVLGWYGPTKTFLGKYSFLEAVEGILSEAGEEVAGYSYKKNADGTKSTGGSALEALRKMRDEGELEFRGEPSILAIHKPGDKSPGKVTRTEKVKLTSLF